MDPNRAKQQGRYGRRPAGQAPAKPRNGHRYRPGEAWAVGIIGLAALAGILYAASMYTQW